MPSRGPPAPRNVVRTPADPAVGPRLPRAFYARGAKEVARDLLGMVLEGPVDGTLRRARITETEAYIGPHDLASHARFGRTGRNASMWGEPGHAYVYFVYGMHSMLNVVCAPAGDAQAVLLRAATPLEGWDARMTGPGLLAKAFAVTRADDGADLVAGPLAIRTGPVPRRVATSPRVGVEYARHWSRRHLRFVAVG